ncbi:unnamed protein product [Coccothraustes coccothraustes]
MPNVESGVSGGPLIGAVPDSLVPPRNDAAPRAAPLSVPHPRVGGWGPRASLVPVRTGFAGHASTCIRRGSPCRGCGYEVFENKRARLAANAVVQNAVLGP